MSLSLALWDLNGVISDVGNQYNDNLDAFLYYCSIESPMAYDVGETVIALASALSDLASAREIVSNQFVDLGCWN